MSLKSITALLSILLATFIFSESYAQTNNDTDDSTKQLITFDVSGEIKANTKAFGNLPTDLIDKFVRYKSLKNISLQKGANSTYRISATFRFYGLKKFKSWYNAEEVKTLLNNLESESPERYQISLNIHQKVEDR